MTSTCDEEIKVRQSFDAYASQRKMRSSRAGKAKHSREETVKVLLASGAGLKLRVWDRKLRVQTDMREK